ncbi:MAG: glycosyltransferase, partial [Anaerolineae bacterium]
IASASGGQTDFLRDGETGFLVPVGAEEVLAERILHLANDERLRRRMSEFNVEYVKGFHISGVAARYEALFSEVIGRSLLATGDAAEDPPPVPERGSCGSE